MFGRIGAITSAGAANPPNVNALPLTIDDIEFQGFEIPERFGPIGGEQLAAIHDFPGGVRTLQTFGAFPLPLTWSGYLTGANAADREQALDRKRATGRIVTLRYGRWAWSGIIRLFEGMPGHQFLIPYRITFEPIEDLSGIGTNASSTNSVQGVVTQQQAALSASTNPDQQIQPLPAGMGDPVTNMQGTLQQGLTNGSGVVGNVPTDDQIDIEDDADLVTGAAAPYIDGNDPTLASPALDSSNNAQAISNAFKQQNAPVATLQSVNPNLYQLAQQYYGDQSRWTDIAKANPSLGMNPQPLGVFDLSIPPK